MGAGLLAGATSGMLGVGGGVIKVPVMNTCMCVPMKAATATSNFMIGVTALAGAVVYYSYGLISPVLAATVAVGVIVGSFIGTRLNFSSEGHRITNHVFSGPNHHSGIDGVESRRDPGGGLRWPMNG